MDCTDPKIIGKIKICCLVTLLILCVIDVSFYFLTDWYVHPHFDVGKTQVDKYSFVFFPVFGFITCWLMVVGSKKLISLVLKRKDTYYHD